ncbi:MAG: SAM-dependent methyltransferase, partial [Saprospiraceae bacterium]|nr:SAM-dependent methyltransferase [Saprospiraceae bacterium]
MSRIAMATRFFKYYRRAKTKYDIHSPFIFDFVQEVLEDERQYYAFSDLENLRNRLKHDHRVIEVTDLGAGSKMQKTNKRKISAIAKTALTGAFFSQVLFRL